MYSMYVMGERRKEREKERYPGNRDQRYGLVKLGRKRMFTEARTLDSPFNERINQDRNYTYPTKLQQYLQQAKLLRKSSVL